MATFRHKGVIFLINSDVMQEYGISPLPKDTVAGMAYVPFQSHSPATYHPIQGFENGTMFKSLNKPFFGKDCDGDTV